jgi:16S rRNA (adenine1518-N6/adenine1519-N6)-dimethyltransferase
MSAQTPAAILALLERHGVRPRKMYGQHFLADRNLIDKVVKLADVAPDDRVVEIGAGTGALTVALVERGARVVAYEVDEELRPILAETLVGRAVDLRFADVMEVNLEEELEGAPWKMVANLPYNVGTPLLLDVLLHVPRIVSMTVMVQTEVADRLIARPGTGA